MEVFTPSRTAIDRDVYKAIGDHRLQRSDSGVAVGCDCASDHDSHWPMLTLVILAGCNRGPKMTPVTGKVIYNGRPLEFGVVMFQPPSGQPAQGEIQPDGTFILSTYRLNDGVVLGKHKVPHRLL